MLDYVLIVVFMGLHAFFSGTETGFYCLNRVRLRFRERLDWAGAAALAKLNANPRLAITTMLIGTNVTVYMTTVLFANKLRDMGAGYYTDLYGSLMLPPILLIFAEITPKSLFQRRADSLMYRTAGMLRIFEVVFSPVLLTVKGIVAVVGRMAGRPISNVGGVFTREKLHFLLSEGAALGLLSEYQHGMTSNLLRLRSVSLQNVMVPLDKVTMVSHDVSLEALKDALRQHRFSRVPVYEGARDNMVSIINVIDLISAEGPVFVAEDLGRAPVCLDAHMCVADGLYALQKARQQIAVVKGPQGNAIGIITVKDMVEEVVGELYAW